MPSENKTPNIGLNMWRGNEYPKRQDFVDDNIAVDEIIGMLADLTTDEKANVVQAINEVKAQSNEKATKAEVNATNLRVDNLVIPISPENVNIEVTDAHNSLAKNKNYTSLKDRFEESEQELIQHKEDYTTLKTKIGTGKNKYNHKIANVGKVLNQLTGIETSDSLFTTSGFTDIKGGKTYYKYPVTGDTRPFAFYDSNKVFISGGSGGSVSTDGMVAPSNAKYLKFTMRYPNGSGLEATSYQDYMIYEKGESDSFEIYYEELTNKKDFELPDNLIESKHFKDLLPNGNLLRVSEVIENYYAYNVSGVLTLGGNAEYVYTIIPVNPSAKYSFTNARYLLELESDKSTVIKSNENSTQIITGTNTKFIAVSIKRSVYPLDTYMIVEGDMPLSYVNNQYKIPWLYIGETATREVYINLPEKIYGIVGKTTIVYFKNITNVKLDDYDINVDCTIGKQYSDRFIASNIVSSGTYPIKIELYKDGTLVASKTINLIVSESSAGTGLNRKILYLGDSTVRSNGTGDITQKLLDNFSSDVMDITLLGTMGTSPNLFEGRGGWGIDSYRRNLVYENIVNPFFNPTTSDFDLSYYMSNESYASVDRVIIQLGINDMFAFTDNATLNNIIPQRIADLEYIVSNIQAYDSNIKIGVNITIPPNDNQDKFGDSYGCGQTQWKYRLNNMTWVNKLIDYFKTRENENIYLVPINTGIDTSINIHDAVHPTTTGYNQIGDTVYHWLKGIE